METYGRNSSDVRRNNRGRVLQMVATGRCKTRQELVSTMGLTKMSISNIVAEFQEKGILVESGKNQAKRFGRRSVNLDISDEAPKVVGVLIVRDRVEAVLCDMKLKIFKRKAEKLKKPDEKELINIVFSLVDEMLEFDSNVVGIGVSSLGPVNHETGVILKPPYFFGIKNLPVAKLLETRYSLPVRVHQDNQSGALEEYLYGNGRGHENLMLLGIERGVGCGVIKDGAVYVGNLNLSPEIGHVSVDYKGRRCVCGNRGCLEMYVNSEEMKFMLEKALGVEGTLEELYAMDETEDVSNVLEDMLERLSAGLSSMINLMNLDLLLLGYDGVLIPEKYINRLERRINERLFYSGIMRVNVKKPFYGKDAQLLGGACNILAAVYNGDIFI